MPKRVDVNKKRKRNSGVSWMTCKRVGKRVVIGADVNGHLRDRNRGVKWVWC